MRGLALFLGLEYAMRIIAAIIPGNGNFFTNDSTTNRYYTNDAKTNAYFTEDQA